MAATDRSCARESDVLDALQRAAWPDCCRPELVAHVAACVPCRELVALAGALVDERDAAMAEARVPTAATMWWRMQLRARREAERRAMRPISLLQALALASGAGLAAAGAAVVSPTVRQFGGWVFDAAAGVLGSPGAQSASAAAGSAGWSSGAVGVAVALSLALVLVVAPLAAVLILRDE